MASLPGVLAWEHSHARPSSWSCRRRWRSVAYAARIEAQATPAQSMVLLHGLQAAVAVAVAVVGHRHRHRHRSCSARAYACVDGVSNKQTIKRGSECECTVLIQRFLRPSGLAGSPTQRINESVRRSLLLRVFITRYRMATFHTHTHLLTQARTHPPNHWLPWRSLRYPLDPPGNESVPARLMLLLRSKPRNLPSASPQHGTKQHQTLWSCSRRLPTRSQAERARS